MQMPQVWWSYLCEAENEGGSEMMYGRDFTVRVWDPRHLRRKCPKCGKQLKDKRSRLCLECNCRKVGRMSQGKMHHLLEEGS